jgi:hypothetical protein
MDSNLVGRIVAVLVVNLVIFGLQILSNRFVPELKKKHYMGLYLILLPLGFGLFGWDLPYWSTAPMVAGGVVVLLVVFKQVLDLEEGSLGEEKEIQG